MTKTMKLFLVIVLSAVPAVSVAQGLDPASLLKPATDSWPQYSGDYSGRRYSTLTAVNKTTVKSLSLAWVGHLTAGEGGASGRGGTAAPTIVGGEGPEGSPLGRNCGTRDWGDPSGERNPLRYLT